MTDGDIITDARAACDAWRDATDLLCMHFRVAWDIERVADRRGRMWGIVCGVVHIATQFSARGEGLARSGMAERDGVTLLLSSRGVEVTALSTAMRADAAMGTP